MEIGKHLLIVLISDIFIQLPSVIFSLVVFDSVLLLLFQREKREIVQKKFLL